MNGLIGHNGHNGYDQRSPRDFSMLVSGMGASPKLVGWTSATTSAAAMSQPNNKTGSLNMCSQDMKKVRITKTIFLLIYDDLGQILKVISPTATKEILRRRSPPSLFPIYY